MQEKKALGEAMTEITIRGNTARVKTREGSTHSLPLGELLDRVAKRRIDTCGMILPKECRLVYTRGAVTILVCEYPPGPRSLRWIAQDSRARFGPTATYRTVRLSLPYVIVFAVFEDAILTMANECFFRTLPLDDLDRQNSLHFPALLNCSRFKPPDGKPLSWICTQNLDLTDIVCQETPVRRFRAGLKSLRSCLFETGFNYSSEEHEYSSWYTESRNVDPRIATVDRWHDETEKEPYFALDVEWLEAEITVAELAERIFANQHVRDDQIRSGQQLARLIINHSKNSK